MNLLLRDLHDCKAPTILVKSKINPHSYCLRNKLLKLFSQVALMIYLTLPESNNVRKSYSI